MIRLCLALTAVQVFFFSALSFATTPEATRHLVKGYEVFLVDLKAGNRFAYTFAVPYGSADDQPQFFGRAHFFEHMMGRGSLKYPGHETLISKMRDLGYSRNAATGLGVTFYYAIGNEAHGLEALDYALAPLFGVELSPTSFENEKKTVINEVIDSAPSRPARALYDLTMAEGLPAGHPLKGYHVGDLTTLLPMKRQDLWSLHRNVYRPGVVRIAIFGNFTSGKISQADLLNQLNMILPSTVLEPEPDFKDRSNQPPLFDSSKVTKVLEVEGKDHLQGHLYFEIQGAQAALDAEHFSQIMTLPLRGSLLHHLKFNKRWITSLEMDVSRIGSTHVAVIDFDFTEQGFENRDEVIHLTKEVLRLYQAEQVPASVLEMYQQAALVQYQRKSRNLESLVRSYPMWLTTKGREPSLMFDWKKQVSGWTRDSVQRGAQALLFDQSFVSFQGPIREEFSKKDPVYKLGYRLRGLKTFLPFPLPDHLKPSNLESVHVDLEQMDLGGPARPLNTWSTKNGKTFVYTHSPEWTDRTLRVDFELPSLSPLQQISLEAWVNGFLSEYSPELFQLQSKGVNLKVAAGVGQLALLVQSEEGQHIPALHWLVNRLVQFRPLESSVSDYKESKVKALQNREQGFPASVALNLATDFLEPRRDWARDVEKVLPSLNSNHFDGFVSGPLQQANKIYYFAGAFTKKEVAATVALTRQLSPLEFSFDGKPIGERLAVQNEKITYHEAWGSPSSNGVAAVRVYRVPSPEQLEDRMAIRVALALLHEYVFLKGRPFGYVQGVSTLALQPDDHHLIFYGQANSTAEMNQVMEIWAQAIGLWQQEKGISSDQIQKAKAGVLASLKQKSTTSADRVSEVTGLLALFRDPFATDRFTAVLENLNEEKIRQVAREVFDPAKGNLTVIKNHDQAGLPAPCSDFLIKDPELVREKLKVGLDP